MNNIPDPIAPLTQQEMELIEKLSLLPREEILQELKSNLQTAIWIELATIPIYLFTYYSIQRKEKSGENIRPRDLFANKAGGVIMSVAVEEMLHMSLSCNILFSLGVDPQLYKHSPGSYPTPLPYHNPIGPPGPGGAKDDKVLIPLSKLTYEQLWHFLQIEYPEKVDALPQDREWDTIGQFYSYIRCLICCPQITDDDFKVRGEDSYKYQIQPYNYSPNNIDTAHPKQAFNSWGIPPAQNKSYSQHQTESYPSAAEVSEFSDQSDSHTGKTELLTVSSKLDALEAIGTICDQGEGFEHEATDDPTHKEDSHYYKFLKLQAQLERYPEHIEKLADLPKPPDPITPTVSDAELSEVIVNFPDNPTTESYVNSGNEQFKPFSDLINGVYQYMLILTETIFKIADEGPNKGGQKLYFNEAMHRSMIWVLDKLIQKMREQKLDNGFMLAPTFENFDLGNRQDAFSNLIKLTQATEGTPYYKEIDYYIDIIKTLPDVSPYWKSSQVIAGERPVPGSNDPGPGEPTPETVSL